MVFDRLSLTGVALAGTLALGACSPQTTTAPGPVGPSTSAAPASVAPSAAAPASVAPSAQASATAAPSALPSAAPTAAATATPAPARGVGILRGVVYDAATELVPDGTTVSVTSLDETVPYEGTTTTSQGQYVLNGVPLGVQIAITATRPGWTSRTRVGVVRPFDPRIENPNVFSFGGKISTTDRPGISYFISPYPEIARVEPTDQDASMPVDELRFKLTMSEPLSSEARRKLAAAFMIIPNNEAALAEDSGLPAAVTGDDELEDLRIGAATPVASRVIRYAYRQNSGFLDGFEMSSFTWDRAGLTATFLLKAPIKTGKSTAGEYAFILIQPDSEPIKDDEGNALGTDETGKFGATVLDDIIYNAIAEPSVNLTEGFDDEEERWADTHLSFSRFSVLEDDSLPKLVAVTARRNYVDSAGEASDRIEMTFSEPMLAFPRISAPGVLSLDNYVFAAAPDEATLADVPLSGDVSAKSVAANSDGESMRKSLAGAARVRISSDRTSEGDFKLAFSVKDPRVVILTLPSGSFPYDADFVKIRPGSDASSGENAERVSDPAGNALDAKADTLVGPIL